MFLAPNPTAVKYALSLKGIDTGSVRLPLIPLTHDQMSEVKNKVN
ncbi:dihydrodipicolinate synthase [Halalkalibacter wakoensis JCM 9140]|uniref:Dihydrodipicolinate synthase n=1 Tax=Halalkalibacter wakoensis JCM 9140 TaxID=1236970 RepID=W4PXV7_9BACI|nr:dihydrodipicolinate synthase [Halalkalibacter wakoensis JCM 9140]